MKKPYSVWSLLVLLTGQCVAAPLSVAQSLADPMRPYGYEVPGTTPGATTAVSAGLQMIKSSREGRVALIDGQEIRVGQKVGDSRLVSLSENAAVLRDPEGKLTTLKMFAEVQKQLAADRSAAKSTGGAR